MRPLVFFNHLVLMLIFAVPSSTVAIAGEAGARADELVRAALVAEQQFDIRGALDGLLAAEKAGRREAFVLQKIARHYSDLLGDQPTRAAQREYAELALAYSRRAAALEPTNAVHVLSLAISYGKLALVGDTAEKVRYSRLVRSEAERALALDPTYAWAHHVLGRWHLEVAELGATSRVFVSLFLGGLPPASVAEAVQHLERAAALEPDELQHHLELGTAYRAHGDPDRARASLQRGLAMPARYKIDEIALTRARATLLTLPTAKK